MTEYDWPQRTILPTTRLLTWISLSVLCLGTPAAAGEYDFGPRTPTRDEVIRMLQPEADQAADPAFERRGITPIRRTGPAAQHGRRAPEAARTIAVQVPFPPGTAALTEAIKGRLLPVAEALASNELEVLRFRVEVQTDAGEEDLSGRRSDAVRDFLLAHLVDPARLAVVSLGAAQLFDPDRPYAAVNNRIRISATEKR